MYEAFYGLSSKPFQLNPDPKFYYSSKPHRRARSYLVYGVMRGEGFIVITGEVGAGKTTIVRDLLDSLENGSVVAAHLVSTQLGAEDALKLVCAAFGVPLRGVEQGRHADGARSLLHHPDHAGQALPADRGRSAKPAAAGGRRTAHVVQLPVW